MKQRLVKRGWHFLAAGSRGYLWHELFIRAVYFIFDDCLNAVHTHIAVWSYDNCLCIRLTENQTVILVSQNVVLTAKQACFGCCNG